MSRPQKIHKPIQASFGDILVAVATGKGKGNASARKLARKKQAKGSAKIKRNTDAKRK
jgi:hypothetical protein